MDKTKSKKMEKLKEFYYIGKNKIKDYILTSWKSDNIYDKGKIVFIGVILFFILVKIIYSIFS